MPRKKTRCLTCGLWRVSGGRHDCFAALAAEMNAVALLMKQHETRRANLGRRLRALWTQAASGAGLG